MSPVDRLRAPRKKPSPAIAVFAKSPVPGRAKTRLIPLLGPCGAAAVQAALILDTTTKVNKLSRHASRWLFVSGRHVPEFKDARQWIRSSQRGRELGARLEAAFRKLLRFHCAAVVVGTDSPLLSARLLRQALLELAICDAVIGPCPDGGFYLIGLRRQVSDLFRGVRLSSRHAYRDTLRGLLRRGLSCAVLPAVPDIDRPRDLRELTTQMARHAAMRTSAPALWRFLRTVEKSWVD